MKREKLGSRLGFILLSAGCAIGIGNVWKFPYMVGQNGGGAFVLLYLFFLLVLGVPVMTMEFSLGRASRRSPVHLYQKLEPKGSKWHIHGYFALAGNVLLMMFYTTVAGWMLNYFVMTAAGKFVGADSAQVGVMFNEMLGNPGTMVLYMGIVVLIGAGVCSIGLQNGLERVTKYMMVTLLGIMLVLAVHGAMTKGGAEGLRFYLLPDLGRVREIGLANVVVGAMNQAFFTLSLGIGSMAIFGSYIEKEHSLMGEAVNVAVLDTVVALASGFIIFPACFAYGVEVESGPPLIFMTLPNIFNHIPLGRLWGSLFFVFLTFAAMSTVLAVFENIIACVRDLTHCSRPKACVIVGVGLFVLSLPCALGFNVLGNVQLMGKGVLDFEDFLVSNLLLPGGSLIYVLFCVSRYGWGWDNFVREANEGDGIKVKNWMRGYMTYILPLVIALILILGLI